uniref:Uncharacterized protein n=1 Tax=Anguilla anguilla TaxID=7936 RepID=A0A0E9X977_ANGAN
MTAFPVHHDFVRMPGPGLSLRGWGLFAVGVISVVVGRSQNSASGSHREGDRGSSHLELLQRTRVAPISTVAKRLHETYTKQNKIIPTRWRHSSSSPVKAPYKLRVQRVSKSLLQQNQ